MRTIASYFKINQGSSVKYDDALDFINKLDKDGKFVDNWQKGIRILPFTSNPTSAIDKSGGLAGATGAFFRMFEDDDVQAIEDFRKTDDLLDFDLYFVYL